MSDYFFCIKYLQNQLTVVPQAATPNHTGNEHSSVQVWTVKGEDLWGDIFVIFIVKSQSKLLSFTLAMT